MSFISTKFYLFLIISFCGFWLFPKKTKPYFLLLCNYFYYASWGRKYIIVLLYLTLVSYFSSIILEKNKKKLLLALSIVIILLPLLVNKYGNIISDFITITIRNFSIFEMFAPIGVSFYTFEAISYVVDSYKNNKANRNILTYACYLSYYPIILSGPIVRFDKFETQFLKSDILDIDLSLLGIKEIIIGLFKKAVIANTIVLYCDNVFNNVTNYQGFSLVIAAIIYSFYIYLDFSGYSNIAIGISKLFGIKLDDNFKEPYLSSSIKEFWQKWHISLSSWLKDYIYIPLGGSRKGRIKKYINILITFLISGIWHGNTYLFVLWGLANALFQIIEDITGYNKVSSSKITKAVKTIINFFVVTLLWVIFRSNNIADMLYMINPANTLCGLNNDLIQYITKGISDIGIKSVDILLILVSVIFDLFNNKIDLINTLNKHREIDILFYSILLILVIGLGSKEVVSFVYFQF